VLQDLNGDGNVDIALTNYSEDFVYALLNDGNGDGTFDPKVYYPVGTQVAADLNGDGKPDLVGVSGQKVRVALNVCRP
jgi:hypothetical protein